MNYRPEQPRSEENNPEQRRDDLPHETCRARFVTYERALIMVLALVAGAIAVAWMLQGRMSTTEGKVNQVVTDVGYLRTQADKDKASLEATNKGIEEVNHNFRMYLSKKRGDE